MEEQEATITSHHDIERKGVGRTAHVVAMVRHIETRKGEGRRLINDPFAERLAGNAGKAYVERYSRLFFYFVGPFSRFLFFLLGSDLLRTVFRLGSPLLHRIPELGMLDGIPIRTRTIDDEIKWNIKQNNIQQIAVLGAGLDSRPWRLKFSDIFEQSKNPELSSKDNSSAVAASSFPVVDYFELDFPEIFDYKLSILSSMNATTDFNYVKVEGDLSLPDWSTNLLQHGFQPTRPTLWILEGFIGYLKEEEFHRLFSIVSQKLSAKGSHFIANFVKSHAEQIDVAKGMHKFRPPNPKEIIEKHGWIHVQEESFDAAGKRLGREIYPFGSVEGHVFLKGEKP
jgi:O-methyltransferase involved in polyketide biosynthesis